MDVWITWCKRTSKCRYCNKQIETAEPMVMCQSINNNRTFKMRFHPQCWVENGLAYLRNNPYTPGMKGRKRLPLSVDDSRRRFLLIRRYNTIKARKSKLNKFPDDILKSIRLEGKMNEIVEEMKGIGGIPTGWTELKMATRNT